MLTYQMEPWKHLEQLRFFMTVVGAFNGWVWLLKCVNEWVEKLGFMAARRENMKVERGRRWEVLWCRVYLVVVFDMMSWHLNVPWPCIAPIFGPNSIPGAISTET